jgi:hypothetical protein
MVSSLGFRIKLYISYISHLSPCVRLHVPTILFSGFIILVIFGEYETSYAVFCILRLPLLCTLFSSAVNLHPYFSSGSIIHVRVDLDNGDGG